MAFKSEKKTNLFVLRGFREGLNGFSEVFTECLRISSRCSLVFSELRKCCKCIFENVANAFWVQEGIRGSPKGRTASYSAWQCTQNNDTASYSARIFCQVLSFRTCQPPLASAPTHVGASANPPKCPLGYRESPYSLEGISL